MSASKVLFSASEDEVLVDMVAKFPCLYDLACSAYKNLVTKDNAWKEVGEAVSRTGKKKFTNNFTMQVIFQNQSAISNTVHHN